MKIIETQQNAALITDQNDRLLSPGKGEIAMRMAEQRNLYINAATADSTRQAYQTDIAHFEAWGGVLPASPALVIAYLQHFADQLNPRTLSRRLVALKHWHVYQHF